jgi:hypothetical protein
MKTNFHYPRALTSQEKGWLDWLLDPERKGYREFRLRLEGLLVIGEGRRGRGNLVLGHAGDQPDLLSPLAPVFAYGVIEAEEGSISVLVREEAYEQVEVEIVPLKGEVVPEKLTEKSRWTYSTWLPGEGCPCCRRDLREVRLDAGEEEVVLALCATDHRLWVYDAATGVNHLIPVTNFYNELMLHKRIREPKIALDPSYLFTHLTEFSDGDFVHGFAVYNKIRKKVDSIRIEWPSRRPRKSLKTIFKKIFAS